jgi:methionine-rich copper-binding protein CopC
VIGTLPARPSRVRRSRWRKAGGVLVALAVLAMVAAAYVASATPARLASSSPAAGAVIPTAPASVSLTFTDRLNPAGSHVSVGTGAGAAKNRGSALVDGRTVTQPVDIRDDGKYLVAYHVQLSNGREVTGVVEFSVDGGAAGRGVPARGAGPADSGGSAPTGGHHAGLDPWTLGAGAAVALVVAIVLVATRRRRGG